MSVSAVEFHGTCCNTHSVFFFFFLELRDAHETAVLWRHRKLLQLAAFALDKRQFIQVSRAIVLWKQRVGSDTGGVSCGDRWDGMGWGGRPPQPGLEGSKNEELDFCHYLYLLRGRM